MNVRAHSWNFLESSWSFFKVLLFSRCSDTNRVLLNIVLECCWAVGVFAALHCTNLQGLFQERNYSHFTSLRVRSIIVTSLCTSVHHTSIKTFIGSNMPLFKTKCNNCGAAPYTKFKPRLIFLATCRTYYANFVSGNRRKYQLEPWTDRISIPNRRPHSGCVDIGALSAKGWRIFGSGTNKDKLYAETRRNSIEPGEVWNLADLLRFYAGGLLVRELGARCLNGKLAFGHTLKCSERVMFVSKLGSRKGNLGYSGCSNLVSHIKGSPFSYAVEFGRLRVTIKISMMSGTIFASHIFMLT